MIASNEIASRHRVNFDETVMALAETAERHEQQVQGNKRGRSRTIRGALLIERAPMELGGVGALAHNPFSSIQRRRDESQSCGARDSRCQQVSCETCPARLLSNRDGDYMYISTFTMILRVYFAGVSEFGTDRKNISPPGTKPGGNYSQGS
jgi:hypothetical protein